MTKINKQGVMVITGGASGLGKAIALQAAQQGWDICVADINVSDGQSVCAQIEQLGVRAYFHSCDVGQVADFEQLVSAVSNQFKRVDVLVNNAGVASMGFLADSTEAEWQRLIELNLMSCIRGSQSFLPIIKQSAKDGKHSAAIVNVASLAAITLAPGMMSYNVVKAGVLAFSKSLRSELVSDNIHVVAACPGFFKTNLVSSMQGAHEGVKQKIEQLMQRSDFTADDVAQEILKAIKTKKFLVLSDKKSKSLERLSRWFPEYFHRQTVKTMKQLFTAGRKKQ